MAGDGIVSHVSQWYGERETNGIPSVLYEVRYAHPASAWRTHTQPVEPLGTKQPNKKSLSVNSIKQELLVRQLRFTIV